MSDISKIDKNFVVETKIEKEDIKFYDADELPFKIYGLMRENGKYRRMPEKVAKTVNDGVYSLHTNTAGGRVRFITDSNYIAINTVMNSCGKMPHFAFTGSIGFDLYSGETFKKSFVPPVNIESGYESIIEFEERKLREITINFPLYSGVDKLYIGLQKDATVKEASPYKNKKPIVYYGSSITQGGCASRPGMSYESIISRELNYDYINLGFSGSARAEDEIAEYISNLPMSLFVYDYDHNAPTVDHLKSTHEKLFLKFREKNPDVPVIFMTAPKYYFPNESWQKRRNIIEQTYKNALSKGDKNVYFTDGKQLMELCGNEGTVDSVHPTDFGFNSMARALIKIIKNIKLD